MRISVFLNLITKEIKFRKKEFRIFIISIIAGSVSVLLFSVLNVGIVEYLRQKMEQMPEYKIITISINEKDDKDEILRRMEEIEEVVGIAEYISFYEEIDYFAIGQTEYMPMSELRFVNNAKDTFVASEIAEFIDSGIVCGRNFKPEDRMKAIIDEFSVLSIGIEEYSDVIGKDVVIGRGDRKIILEIVGVSALELSIDKENVGVEMFDSQNRQDIGLRPVIVSADAVDMLMGEEIIADHFIKVTAASVYDVDMICSQLEVLNVTMFTEGDDFKKVILYLDTIREILQILSITLLIIAIINMISSLCTVLAENCKWYSLLQVMGYRKGNVVSMVLVELLGLTIIALFGSAVIIAIIVNVFNYALRDMMSVVENGMFSFPTETILWLSGGICGMVSIIAVCMTYLMMSKEMK